MPKGDGEPGLRLRIGKAMSICAAPRLRARSPICVTPPIDDRLSSPRNATPACTLADSGPAGRSAIGPFSSRSAPASVSTNRAESRRPRSLGTSVRRMLPMRSYVPVTVHCHCPSLPPSVVPRCATDRSPSRRSTSSPARPNRLWLWFDSKRPFSVAVESPAIRPLTKPLTAICLVWGSSVRNRPKSDTPPIWTISRSLSRSTAARLYVAPRLTRVSPRSAR